MRNAATGWTIRMEEREWREWEGREKSGLELPKRPAGSKVSAYIALVCASR